MVRATQSVSYGIIPFSEWCAGIAPLWGMQGREEQIHQTLQGHGQFRYPGREAYERVLLFPLAANLNGSRVGWTSVYNISEKAIRIRGIYVLENYRGLGVGRGLVNHAIDLWPFSFSRCFMYARVSNVGRYIRWGFQITPGFTPRAFEMRHLSDDKEVVLMHKDR